MLQLPALIKLVRLFCKPQFPGVVSCSGSYAVFDDRPSLEERAEQLYFDSGERLRERVNAQVVCFCFNRQYLAEGDTLADKPIADADMFGSI